MKTASLRFVIVGVVTTTVGLGFAGVRARLPKIAATTDRPAEVRPNPLVKIPQEPGASRIGNPPNQSALKHQLDQPVLDRSAAVGKAGLAENKTADHRQIPERSLPGDETTWISPGARSERTIVATGIGALTLPNDRHSAATINGTEIKRRP
jgi:hypothetical protein